MSDSTKINKLTFSIPYDVPNRNNTIISKEALEEAILSAFKKGNEINIDDKQHLTIVSDNIECKFKENPNICYVTVEIDKPPVIESEVIINETLFKGNQLRYR